VSVELSELHQIAGQRLSDAELLYTKGRRELVELLSGLTRPATMPELLDMRPRLTQSSMYRNMTDLETAGVVQKVVGADDRTRYELAEELIGHHHHSICTACGAVDDVVIPARTERTLESALANAVEMTGFLATGHRLDVIGLCAQCRAK
jgi:Fe2+ or Zn2+ uptake regulation protein